jgi:HK97 family phage portal protein
LDFIGWLRSKLGGSVPLSGDMYSDIDGYISDIAIREMAFWSGVNLIANGISKCEFRTFYDGKETKGDEYYLWNLEPNKNQSSTAFIQKLISKLYGDGEALVIEQNNQLLVADSFDRKQYALYDDVFSQVTVKDFTFSRTFLQSEVLYWNKEKDMRRLSNSMFDSYSKLISHAMKAYQKSRGTKGVFSYQTLPIAGTPERAAFDNLITEKFKKFIESDNAIIPLGNGQKFEEVGARTYSYENTRDIRAMINDISDFTAKSLVIPPSLLRGDVQNVDSAVDQFLTFCIDTLADFLQEEINRKRNGKAVLTGTRLQIDTKQIKHVDLMSVATPVDKLISSGVFCINDILKLVGEQEIEEPWAKEHFITKNYAKVTDILAGLEGGTNTV